MMGNNVAAAPTSDERTLAMLAHILQLFTGFIGPLVIYVVKRESRFVGFHAVQALLWQAIYFVIAMLGVVVWIAMIFGIIASHASSVSAKGPPPAFFFMFPLLWLFFLGGWVITMILGIVYGIRASHGDWAGYPIIGGWARRLVPN